MAFRALPRLLPRLSSSIRTFPKPRVHSSRPLVVPGLLVVSSLSASVAYASASPETTPSKEEIAAAQAAIHDLIDENDDLGPTLVRLAWHASGTYDKESKTGGSDGATMRFEPESGHGANAGLVVARTALEPVKQLFPGISYVETVVLNDV